MERQKFEDKLKDAFSDAELLPSARVWNSIEVDLLKEESTKMKKRVFFYQSLAAASVIFGLAIGGATLYYSQTFNNTSFIASSETDQNKNTKNTNIPNSELTENSNSEFSESSNAVNAKTDTRTITNTDTHSTSLADDNTLHQSADQNREDSEIDVLNENNSLSRKRSRRLSADSNLTALNSSEQTLSSDGQIRNEAGTVSTDEVFKSQVEPAVVFVMNENKLHSQVKLSPVTMHLPEQPKADEVALMLARLNDLEKSLAQTENKKKKSDDREGLWTSLGFAAGAFSASNASVSTPNTSMNTFVASSSNDIAKKEAKASGVAYSMGLNVGAKLAERWVLQGGLSYMTQNSAYTADNALGSPDLKSFSPASINGIDELNGEKDVKLVSTAPYNVNNSVQYLSVPMQAGYLLVNKKFGLQLNAGISTDMFINNKKTAEGNNMDNINQGRDSAPYRPVNFSGLMGAEFTYKISHRYRVAINPGLRYPFNTIYKSDLGIKSNPLTYDVGLRFRYIFQ